ncbi:MAG: inositol monophosphatase family protein [Methylococcales bacterium]|nr:inositol monophosphatase family protein [Methylococcales bacterium]
MKPMTHIAVRAARAAGDLISRSANQVTGLRIDQKGLNDYATEVDQAAEQEIIKILHNAYPDHAILAEESGQHGRHDYVWIIDPLDGTTNFIHGFPFFSVSIALQVKNKLEIGVVYDPVRDELFVAERGGGATLNNRKLRVTRQSTLKGALIGTGFPFREQQHVEAYLGMFKAMNAESAGVRRAGSAALDLCYVACGRMDAFWELGLKAWDMAAGVLMIQEAGGVVTDFAFGDRYLECGNLIAGNPKMQQLLYQAFQPHLTAALPR